MFNIVGAWYLTVRWCHLSMTLFPLDLMHLRSMLSWMRISRPKIINTTVLVLLRLEHLLLCFLFYVCCFNFITKFPSFQVSPNNKFVAYAEDTKGDEIYTVYVMDAETLALIGEPLHGTTSYVEWAGDQALVYITMDEILRPDKVGQFSFFVPLIDASFSIYQISAFDKWKFLVIAVLCIQKNAKIDIGLVGLLRLTSFIFC